MKSTRLALLILPLALALAAGGCATNDNTPGQELVVNSLDDTTSPPAGTMTLRSALAAAASGDTDWVCTRMCPPAGSASRALTMRLRISCLM